MVPKMSATIQLSKVIIINGLSLRNKSKGMSRLNKNIVVKDMLRITAIKPKDQ